MARALAKRGQHVKLFCNTPEPDVDAFGVEFYPINLWAQYARSATHDAAIVQRRPECFASRTAARLNLLWMHDLAMGRNAKGTQALMWNVDKLLMVSKYAVDQYRQVTGLPEDLFYQTRNGLDLLAMPTQREPRLKRRLIYSARPERGLDVLLRDIMPKLLAQDPDLQLHVFGYHNPVEHLQHFYDECKRYGERLGGHVVFREPLTKAKLYEEYNLGGCYVYPTPSPRARMFAEVSCISAMEAQACGLPIVTSARGALPETIAPGAGTLIEGDPWSQEYQHAFCDAVMRYVHSPEDHAAASQAGIDHAQTLSWDDVAQDWIVMIEREIRARNDNPHRLLRHMWRESDIIAMREIPGAPAEEIKRLAEPFAFAFGSREDFVAQYERIGKGHTPEAFEQSWQEPRCRVMIDWLKANDEIKTVLDYGCGCGGYAYAAATEAGKTVTALDHDKYAIEIAERKKIQHNALAKVQYAVANEEMLGAGAVDCGILQEVLEHVPQPWDLLQRVEAQVKLGGWMYLTVPLGPWEYSSYHTYPWRCHIWNFDQHDIRDMLGAKQDLSISSYFYGDSAELGEAMGWWIISYRADHEPIGKIDMQRKLWLQRPRQTVSASLIVGGREAGQTLRWCLDSLTHVADEIVIADCGMSNDDVKAVLDFPYTEIRHPSLRIAKVIPGQDPLENGFEVARNACLAQCSMDWVLWIDADEKLINPRQVQKYLRENMFHGYGIRQHHFACDTTFEPDMPVRLFRRRPTADGKQMRFYGALHEHAELGLNEGPGQVIVISDCHIAHVGYLIEGTRQRRFVRNYRLLKLDQERYPDRLIQKHFLMRDTLIMAREALAQNRGRLEPSIIAKLREVVGLYRKYFLGTGRYAHTDSLQYYSEALQMLGEGFEVAFQIAADKDDAKPNGTWKYRFASRDDFLKELNLRANEKIGTLDAEWW
jgi:2-polyprenyl-3-methyl-5-hydroxy-6-metoxy-1,4-benzoquinol methylase/glycosyltransferase involved in cell wall biosynthesis